MEEKFSNETMKIICLDTMSGEAHINLNDVVAVVSTFPSGDEEKTDIHMRSGTIFTVPQKKLSQFSASEWILSRWMSSQDEFQSRIDN